jgi:hypothetical protein
MLMPLEPLSDEIIREMSRTFSYRLSAGIAFHSGRIGERRFVNDGGARDQPVLDLDMDRHVVVENDAAWLDGASGGAYPSVMFRDAHDNDAPTRLGSMPIGSRRTAIHLSALFSTRNASAIPAF